MSGDWYRPLIGGQAVEVGITGNCMRLQGVV